jgi:two-component system chemotaxis response regulator CheB
MMSHPIKLLVVDDSPVMRALLVHVLNSDPGIHVVGAVADGRAAVEFVLERKPDAVLMDIHMPGLDGFETTRLIMETQPVPIIICTATANPTEVATSFRSLDAGALACVAKPVSPEHRDFEPLVRNLLQTVRLMAEVKVVRRWRRPCRELPASLAGVAMPRYKDALIGIGTSTGGPPVLKTIFSLLPKNFGAPILVVQHIAVGFLTGLVEWLGQTTPLAVHVAAHGVVPEPGHVYFAPDEHHMGWRDGHIVLTQAPPENGLRPAVSHLFRSLASAEGLRAMGVLLTGMGRDGADELKLMRDHGALTIAQDEASCAVYGMPGQAVAIGAATHVLAPEMIASMLLARIEERTTT